MINGLSIFINSEKHVLSKESNSEISYDEIIDIAGYPSTGTYIIKDELSSLIYQKGDIIKIYNNISLMITPNDR